MSEVKNTNKDKTSIVQVLDIKRIGENISSEEPVTSSKRSGAFSTNIFELIKENEKLPPPTFFWGPIQPGSFGFIFGPAKSGKTIFCENLGLALAAGQDSFFGEQINKGHEYRVLFISIEEHWRNRTYRNSKQVVKLGYNENDLQHYNVVGDDFPRSFEKVSDFIQAIRKDIEEFKPNVVFVDSLTRLVGNDYSKADIGRKVVLPFRELADKKNLALVMIHHSVKEDVNQRSSPLDFNAMAGSRVFSQEADFIIGIRKTQDGIRYVKESASRYKEESETVTTFKINNSLCIDMQEKMSEYKALGAVSAGRNIISLKERVKRAIKTRWDSGENTVKRNSLVEDLKEHGGQSRIYDIINELVEEGFAVLKFKMLVKPESKQSEESSE